MAFTKQKIEAEREEYEEEVKRLMSDDEGTKVALMTPRVNFVGSSPSQRRPKDYRTPEQIEDDAMEGRDPMNKKVWPPSSVKRQEESYRQRQELNKLKSDGGPR